MLLIFWGLALWRLDRFPSVHYDEPTILAPGYQLFARGVYGSIMFTGFYGQEKLFLEVPPLMSLLQGLSARFLGVGVWQMRFAPVALGVLTLALTFAVGRAWINVRVGALAALLLLLWQWTPGGQPFLGSGLPLLDVARIARYDILVPPLGLGAFWAWLRARRTDHTRAYALSGLLAGLAGLANVYGLFWVVALMGMMLIDNWLLQPSCRGVLRRAGWVGFGAAVPWLGWGAIILAHWPEARGQFSKHVGRFDLLNPAFYLDSLMNEIHRYALGVREPGTLFRVGFWLVVVGVPLVLAWLGWRATRYRDRRAMWLLVPCLLFPALFALFVNTKRFYYLMMLVPLLALALAWGLARVAGRRRWMVALLLGVMIIQAALGITRMQSLAREVDSPAAFFAKLRQAVPLEAGVILGPPQYWFALPQRDYRSTALPFLLSGPRGLAPIPFDAALNRVAPEVVLVERSLLDSLTNADQLEPLATPRTEQFWDFMRQHQARLVGELYDYEGALVQVYGLEW
ncbi:MAG: ArnT family glycosyltransferase [Anaerolineales bacterium]